MRLRNLLIIALIAGTVTGCSCRRSGYGIGNIPLAEEGGDLKDVHFSFDSFELDASSRAVLDANAKWLEDNSGSEVTIEGHCDERGTNEYNMVLGLNRAKAVFDYMRSLGISEDRMSTISYGEEIPLDPSHTEAAWSRNRRAHFSMN